MISSAVMLPFPPLLMVFFAVAAALSFLLHRWARYVALAGAAVAALLAFGLWLLDLSRPVWMLPIGIDIDFGASVMRFGYTFELQDANAPVLVISLAITAGALLLAAREDQDENFPAVAWVLVGAYSLLAFMTGNASRPILSAPIWLTSITALGVFVLQGGQRTSVSGPVRTLIPPVLATPLFLLAAWYLGQIPLDPQNVILSQIAGGLLGIGLLLMLMPFPLHSAWPAAAETARPPATLLVMLLYEVALLFVAFRLLSTYPFMVEETNWPTWLSWAGLITAVWGGIATLGATRVGRLWGYAALHDWGLIVLALASPGIGSWNLVLFLFALRAVSMFTAAAGLTTLIRHVGGTEIARLSGAGSRLPWNSAAFLLGGLGLVGFPLSAGFAGHWAALQTIAAIDWRPAAIVLISSGVAVVSFVRVARLMFGQLENRTISRERPLTVAVAIASLIVVVAVAVAPQLLNDLIGRALAAFG